MQCKLLTKYYNLCALSSSVPFGKLKGMPSLYAHNPYPSSISSVPPAVFLTKKVARGKLIAETGKQAAAAKKSPIYKHICTIPSQCSFNSTARVLSVHMIRKD